MTTGSHGHRPPRLALSEPRGGWQPSSASRLPSQTPNSSKHSPILNFTPSTSSKWLNSQGT